MNKYNTTIAVAVISTMLVSALFLTAPAISMTDFELPELNVAFAAGAENEVELAAELLPNGQYGYRMVSHEVDGDDVTDMYSEAATIPGPTIVIKEGESLDITVTNSITGIDADVEVEDLDFGSADTGTYLYKGKEGSLVGLFGAIVVNDKNGRIESFVDGGNGKISRAKHSDLEKEFVMFMVGSTFWVMEMDEDGEQMPLWTNPMISAKEGDLVRFHILSVGPGHTFHLHAHRWVDPGTSAIIDTKLMEPGQDVHVFTVSAGDEVGPGHWQYHCHVFAHMEAGMHGMFHVVESGDAESHPGASPYGVHPIYDADADDAPGLVSFEITDEPGKWFKAMTPLTSTEQSLVLARPGDSVNFVMSQTNTVHTITSLLWPTGAEHFPMDEVQSYKGGGIVVMDEPGLYVFTCKVHPYMFGGVIADDLDTAIETDDNGDIVSGTFGLPVLGNIVDSSDPNSVPLLDLGDNITLVNGLEVPTGSDLALRLAATFFKATDSANWKDYREDTYNPSYPGVPVKAAIRPDPDAGTTLAIAVTDLDLLLDLYFAETTNEDISGQLHEPGTPGVGEVWVDTQFEHTEGKTKPGTATAVDTSSWLVTKKVALPEINMNNPHNMWTDDDQEVIYQTEWFDNKLTIFDRESGQLLDQIQVGEAPSHVMTRSDNGDIHVALNGEEGVAEILAGADDVNRIIAMQGFGQNPTHPHAHWMSSDGQTMVTPNMFTHDTTIFGFDTDQIEAKPSTGIMPIATGMMPDDSKYYVANLLSSSLTVVDMDTFDTDEINLLADYNPFPLQLLEDLDFYNSVLGTGHHPTIGDFDGSGVIAVGALPIQTPVSPDGKHMVTANTLSGTITIVDTDEDEVVKMLGCDPGCHGVQFGAKSEGGYYAYVSSKFSNAMIVIDMDSLTEVGRVLLVADSGSETDDDIVDDDYTGMGGQGILPIPNVYNGWVQKLPDEWLDELTEEQKDPIG
jgi:DNA-binding beta-propeller fold protein YncE